MITSADLYAMAMESSTAAFLMRDLCDKLGMPYPPEFYPDNSKRQELPDPLEVEYELKERERMDRLDQLAEMKQENH